MNVEKIRSRAFLILDIARKMADKQSTVLDCTISNHVEEIQLHTQGYAERWYTQPSTGLVATGNWNDVDVYDRTTSTPNVISTLPSRVSKLFEKLGIECEWADEWMTCNDCQKLLRKYPDSHIWKPSYKDSDSECVCLGCAGEDEDEEDE